MRRSRHHLQLGQCRQVSADIVNDRRVVLLGEISLAAMLRHKTKPYTGSKHQQGPMAHPRQLEWQKISRLNFVRRFCSVTDHQRRPIGVFVAAVGQLDRSAEALLQSCFAVKPAGCVAGCEALGQAEQQPANRERQADNASPKQISLRNRDDFEHDQRHQPKADTNQQSAPHAAPAELNFSAPSCGLYFGIDDLFFAHAKA